jgi:hypothetical protein
MRRFGMSQRGLGSPVTDSWGTAFASKSVVSICTAGASYYFDICTLSISRATAHDGLALFVWPTLWADASK